MRLLDYYVFFLLFVVKIYSKPIAEMGPERRVVCSGVITSSIIFYDQVHTEWDKDYIYPMQACITVKGPRVLSCPRSNESKIELFINPYEDPEEKSIILTAPIDLNKFDASNVICHTFLASDMASKLQGKNLIGSRVLVGAFLLGMEKSDQPSTFQIFLRAAPYKIDAPGGEAIALKNHKLHAVVCKFPKCIVAAEGPFRKVKTENFHVENLAPRYEKEPGLLTDKMFSVTYFEYDIQKCPSKFTASTASTDDTKPPPEVFPGPEPSLLPTKPQPPPPQPKVPKEKPRPSKRHPAAQVPLAVVTKPSNAPYHLSLGTFVVATLLVLEA